MRVNNVDLLTDTGKVLPYWTFQKPVCFLGEIHFVLRLALPLNKQV